MDLKLATPLTLPNGLVLPNRLTKAAMAENLAKKGLPTPEMRKAYAAWATGGWGMVLTGNVQVDERHLGGPRDVVLLDDRADGEMLAAWRAWAAACKGDGEGEGEGEGDGKAGGGRRRRRRPVAVMQINHPGRQSPRGAGKRGLFAPAMAPSAVPLRLGSGLLARLVSALVFGTPREMTAADIEDVVRRFAETARVAAEAGFDGAEIHAAHGYLLAQFLSPRTNLRTDAYGANPAGRAKILVDVVRAMREATPEGFAIGIKFNSVDHQSESELRDCIEQLRAITEAGVDFLEVSGGTYEDPSVSFVPQSSESTLYFGHMTARVASYPPRMRRRLLSEAPGLAPRSRTAILTLVLRPLDVPEKRRDGGEVVPDQGPRGLLPRVRARHPIFLPRPPPHGDGRLPDARGHGGRAGLGRVRPRRARPARVRRPGAARDGTVQQGGRGRRSEVVRQEDPDAVDPEADRAGRGRRGRECKSPLLCELPSGSWGADVYDV